MNLLIFISAVISLVLGLVLMYVSIKNLYFGHISKTWNVTNAQTIKSELDASGNHLIEYLFHVEGDKYIGTRYKFDFGIGAQHQEKEIEFYIKNPSEGDDIDIYYDPKNPEQSVLVSGIWNFTYLILLFALFLIVEGILFLFDT